MKNKIKQNKGVTIIHALCGLLIFSVISSIIYSSAATNLKSLQKETEYQQAYYTVSSAAQAFVEGIENDYIEFQIGRSDKKQQLQGQGIKYYDLDAPNPLNSGNTNKLISLLKEYIIAADSSNKVREYTYYMKVDGGESVFKLVKVDFFLSGYNIYANFSLDGVASNENYYICVEAKGLNKSDEFPILYETEETTPNPDESSTVEKDIVEAELEPTEFTQVDTYYVVYSTRNITIAKGAFTANETQTQ